MARYVSRHNRVRWLRALAEPHLTDPNIDHHILQIHIRLFGDCGFEPIVARQEVPGGPLMLQGLFVDCCDALC